MENIKLGDLYLSKEESKDIIEFLAKKRNTKNYKNKSSDRFSKIFKKQSKNKKRIDDIKDELKNPTYNISQSESKDIKRTLYNIEKRNVVGLRKTKRYLDELDKKILKLDKYHDYNDYEYKGMKDLFKLSIDKDHYKPILVKSGYNNNYVQYGSKGDRILTIQEYLGLIEKYLRKLINHYKNEGEWKIQLIAEINFISLKPGSDGTRVMYTRSNNEEFVNGSYTDEVIKLLFEPFLQKHEVNSQEKMRGSDFEFDGVHFLYYDFNKTSINRGGPYIDSPKWFEDKKSTINPRNDDHKFFQYVVTLALNLNRINKHPQRISKIKPFIDQYNWKDIDFPATSKDWKNFELNNEITLNILYVTHNTRKIHVAYKLKHNLTRENQIALLMITDGEKWHYLTVKNLSGLLRGIKSNHAGDFYCLNCFCAYYTKNKFEAHTKRCENHDYWHVEMPTKDNNTIKYNQGKKSMQLPFTIYADLECLLEEMSTCQNNPNESSTIKINKHSPSGYSLFTHCSFDNSKNKLNYYRGEDFMKKFGKDLRTHATKKINYENKKMISLTIKEEIYHNKQKYVTYAKRNLIKMIKNNKK